MTPAPPLQLIVGARGHGVAQYAADLAAAAGRQDARTQVVEVGRAGEALDALAGQPRVHVHVTDRLFGASPEEAADLVVRMSGRTRLSLTLHDVPQSSDGTMMARRIAAYSRMASRAAGVVVNSRHERSLVAELLTGSPMVEVVPLGTRVGVSPATPSPGARDTALVVLIAGYVYPGKGHAPAIEAAAEAAATLRAEGEQVDAVVVRAIGGASAGHEDDVGMLRDQAARTGVAFEITGYLDDTAFAREIRARGIPLAAHEHVSASRSMLDWVEAGRRPLVAASRYVAEMARLRRGTFDAYAPADLAGRLAQRWRAPATTWLAPGTVLAPTIDDCAADYLAWWRRT